MNRPKVFHDYHNANVPSFTVLKSNQYPTFFHPSSNQSSFQAESRYNIHSNRPEYDEYQRNRSPSNFDFPKTACFFIPQCSENQHKKCLEKLEQNRRERKTLDDFIKRQEDSKIFNSYESTTAKKQDDENLKDSKYFLIKNSQPSYSVVTKSEIKSSRNSLDAENIRMGFSNIDPRQSFIKNLAQTNNSSRFQKLTTQQSLRQQSKNSWTRDFPLDESSDLKSAINTDYRYELMKEECEFLRDKFIEHVKQKHGIKF